MDEAHFSAWLHCLSASDELESDMDLERKKELTELLDLPASYGGTGLQSLTLAADEEFVGSFAGIPSALIAFCRNTLIPAYIRIAEALEGTESEEADAGDSAIDREVKEAYARMEERRRPISEEEFKTTTALVRGCKMVETHGHFDPDRPNSIPEPVSLPEPKSLSDFVTAPCKRECSIVKQIRHAKQAHRILTSLNSTRKLL